MRLNLLPLSPLKSEKPRNAPRFDADWDRPVHLQPIVPKNPFNAKASSPLPQNRNLCTFLACRGILTGTIHLTIDTDYERTTAPQGLYDPKTVEEKWYRFWEEKRFFQADAKSHKPAYCIVIPPPNVTGVLHMGHALVDTLQDVLIRWKRMSGFEALWVPGTDHAGIATQTVVERHLMATTGKRRKDFSREEFLAHVWKWKEQSEAQILSQLKKLGCSCDWSRLCFTMDEKRNRAVRTMFKKMFDARLIYRGDYLVNWDPVTQTALADDEVEYEERESFLWYFRYPLADKQRVHHDRHDPARNDARRYRHRRLSQR